MIKVGLTGSIGMGKSTVASMFKKLGYPVQNADDIVHKLYSGQAVQPIQKLFPSAIVNHQVDRKKLAQLVANDPAKFKQLEAIVHPLVRKEEQKFFIDAERSGANLAVIDIPLLFETNSEDRFDVILVVSADEKVQQDRVLSREGMTEVLFKTILSKQMPDKEKRKRSHFIIDTNVSIEETFSQIEAIAKEIAKFSEK